MGQCLFLAYINDLPDSVKSKVRLFADDTIMYLTVKTSTDVKILQNDLHALEQWEQDTDWSMEFNSDKCNVLRITCKRNPVIFPYKLHKRQHSPRKPRRGAGRLSTSPDTKTMAYNTYVRPQLEYCSTIWNPWQITLSQKIESVQWSAARYVFNNYHYTSSVTSMLKSLNWHTLEYRRNNSSLMYFYNIRNALVQVDHQHLISTRNLNYLIPHSNTVVQY